MKNITKFETKDSGERQDYPSGMVRDIQEGKPRFDLIWQPGLLRLAQLMERGVVKYGQRNWEKANSQEELARFKASAYRHFFQWFNGLDTEEDHMVAVVFNLFAAEYLKDKLSPFLHEKTVKKE